MLADFLSHIGFSYLALLPIVDPLGVLPVFYIITAADSRELRRKQAVHATYYSLAMLLSFYILGDWILKFFGINIGTLQVAGGAILAHTAWTMLTAKDKLTETETQEVTHRENVALYPLALPLIAGPGAISVVMGLSIESQSPTEFWGSLVGIVLMMITVLLTLLLGQPLLKILGRTGIGALQRLFGFFILAIAVRLAYLGILALVREGSQSLG